MGGCFCVFEHEQLSTMAQFRLSNAGLGNRFPRNEPVQYDRRTSCPLCSSPTLSENHVVFFCPAVKTLRKELNLNLYRTICQKKGYSEDETLCSYINGLDCKGNQVSGCDFVSRGRIMDTIRENWLSQW